LDSQSLELEKEKLNGQRKSRPSSNNSNEACQMKKSKYDAEADNDGEEEERISSRLRRRPVAEEDDLDAVRALIHQSESIENTNNTILKRDALSRCILFNMFFIFGFKSIKSINIKH
jgi:hypothetical protein